jgi:DNA polymerase III delta prime subunit
MKQIREIYKRTGKLHHAYGILGQREMVRDEIFSFLIKDLKFPVTNNPDFWQGEFNVFKIDNSRDLNESHLKLPIKYDKKVFVISANFITKGAQNSLLKIFEEPRADTIFFLLLPADAELLPTLKSRLIFGSYGVEEKKQGAEEFLSAKIGKRMDLVAKILKDIKDEKLTKADAISFVKNIEVVLSQEKKKDLSVIKELERAISYLNDEAPSIKVILEHLAITV